MERTLLAVVVLTMVAGGWAGADLTFLTKSEYELRNPGTQTQLPPEDPEAAGRSLPEMMKQGTQDLPWLKGWMVAGKWRRDLFEQDPRTGAEPVFSIIRLEGSGQTIMLDWQERVAEISDDAATALWEQQTAGQEQEARAALTQQMQEYLNQLPPEQQQKMREHLAAMGGAGQQPGARPVITVQVEGPLGGETILGLACTKYKFTVETHQALGIGPWAHTREQTWVLLTEQLTFPPCESNPWEWRGGLATVGCAEAWEQATEGMQLPRGVPMKRYTIQEDLITGAVGVLQGEMVAYDQATIAPSVFEVPAGFTVQQMELPEIGGADAG